MLPLSVTIFPPHGKLIWCSCMYATFAKEKITSTSSRSSSGHYRIDSMNFRTSVKATTNYLIEFSQETFTSEEKRSRMYGAALSHKTQRRLLHHLLPLFEAWVLWKSCKGNVFTAEKSIWQFSAQSVAVVISCFWKSKEIVLLFKLWQWNILTI